jgi:hypothetical protein
MTTEAAGIALDENAEISAAYLICFAALVKG